MTSSRNWSTIALSLVDPPDPESALSIRSSNCILSFVHLSCLYLFCKYKVHILLSLSLSFVSGQKRHRALNIFENHWTSSRPKEESKMFKNHPFPGEFLYHKHLSNLFTIKNKYVCVKTNTIYAFTKNVKINKYFACALPSQKFIHQTLLRI